MLWAQGMLGDDGAAVSCWSDFPGYSAAVAHGGAPALAEALDRHRVGVEPDPRFDKRRRDAAAAMVVFDHQTVGPHPPSNSWGIVSAVLRLAAHVAAADGPVNSSESHAAVQGALSIAGLAAQHEPRAQARMMLHAAKPADRALKRTAVSVPQPLRETAAALLVEVAACDGRASNTEMACLERIFDHLGMPEGDVYTRMHQTFTSTAGSSAASGLDRERIAARSAETVRVQDLLAEVFADDDLSADATEADAPEADGYPDGDPAELGVWDAAGLDARHAAFAATLCTRSEWSRWQAEALAAEHGLTMLAGALDRVNGAALDIFDEPLAEGSDPIWINADANGGSG